VYLKIGWGIIIIIKIFLWNIFVCERSLGLSLKFHKKFSSFGKKFNLKPVEQDSSYDPPSEKS